MDKPSIIDGAEETIFSLSSASGRAGVAVFRLSGPASQRAIEVLTGRALPKPRYAALRQLKDKQGQPIDEALTLWFPAPASFTGEECAEFHTHGSAAVISGLSQALLSLGLRQAEPGEFTRRAVQNGKMDLTEAEGLADLIDAQTEGQRVQALRQMGGGLRDLYEDWRERLLDALAQIEGEIDFPDEGDIPDTLSHAAYAPLQKLAQDMEEALGDMGRGAAIRSGLDVAIIGAPNAGKSTLINSLTRRDVAITSPEAGTTRDIVEAQMVIAGLPVTLSDTAGLRETENAIEAEGVKRAKKRAEEAEITIYVVRPGTTEFDPEIANKLSSSDIILLNKTMTYDNIEARESAIFIEGDLLASETEKQVYQALETIISNHFSVGQDAGLTRERHGECVRRAKVFIEKATVHLGVAPELAGDDLRSALKALSELAGETDIEAVFDRIFSRFCVGK
jgi:tRNA modification GTPase